MAYRCHRVFFFFSVKKVSVAVLSFFIVAIDQNTYGVSYSRWRQQLRQEDEGVERGLKSLCKAKLSSK